MPYKKRREKIYVCEECGFSTGDVRLVPNPFHTQNLTQLAKVYKLMVHDLDWTKVYDL